MQLIAFYVLRGHTDTEMLDVINDPCRKILYHAIMEKWYDDNKPKGKHK